MEQRAANREARKRRLIGKNHLNLVNRPEPHTSPPFTAADFALKKVIKKSITLASSSSKVERAKNLIFGEDSNIHPDMFKAAYAETLLGVPDSADSTQDDSQNSSQES